MKRQKHSGPQAGKRNANVLKEEADRFVRFVDIIRNMERDSSLTILEAKFRQYPTGALEQAIRPVYLAIREAELASPPGYGGYAAPILCAELDLAASYVSEAVFIGMVGATISLLPDNSKQRSAGKALHEVRFGFPSMEWGTDLLGQQWSMAEGEYRRHGLTEFFAARAASLPKLKRVVQILAPSFGAEIEEMARARTFSEAALVHLLFDGPSATRIFRAAIEHRFG